MPAKRKNSVSLAPFRSLPIFSELSPEQLKKISSLSKIVYAKKNDTLFWEGDTYKGFFVLLEGTVRVYRVSADGVESTLHLIQPNNTFAEVPLFEECGYPVNAQAISDATLLFIPKDEFIRLIRKNSTICYNMLKCFAKRMRYLTQRVEDLSTKELSSRFARYLLDELRKNGTLNSVEPFVRIGISKKNIASYIGTITDTFSRLLKKLQNENIIRVSGKTIFVLDVSKLKKLAK